jgi:carbohydrate-selective porin OprB
MQNVGLVYKGLLNQRPQDELALGVARIHINDDWNDVQAKEYDTEYNTSFTTVFMPLTGNYSSKCAICSSCWCIKKW